MAKSWSSLSALNRARTFSTTLCWKTGLILTGLSDFCEQTLINGRFSTTFPQRDGSISTTLSDFFEQTFINRRFWTTQTGSGGRESTTFSGFERILGPFGASGGRFSTTFWENVVVFRPPFQKMWASFDHQTVICKILGGVVVDILPP